MLIVITDIVIIYILWCYYLVYGINMTKSQTIFLKFTWKGWVGQRVENFQKPNLPKKSITPKKRWGRRFKPYLIFYSPFIWIKRVKQKSDNGMLQPPGSVASAEIPLMGGWTLRTVGLHEHSACKMNNPKVKK